MGRRRPPKAPANAARYEDYLDKLAEIMARAGPRAIVYAPLWKRLERERDRLREEEAIVAAARDRLTRSQDRMAGRSS